MSRSTTNPAIITPSETRSKRSSGIINACWRRASAEPYLAQIRDMAAQAKAAGLNIDYFPTNFVVRDEVIWYVDYECNEFMDEWSFENWGIRYWSRTPEFEAYLKDFRQKEMNR